jgi:hypothetical protein
MTEDSPRSREAHAIMSRIDDLIRCRIRQHERRRKNDKPGEKRARDNAYEIRETLHTSLMSLGMTIEEAHSGDN